MQFYKTNLYLITFQLHTIHEIEIQLHILHSNGIIHNIYALFFAA